MMWYGVTFKWRNSVVQGGRDDLGVVSLSAGADDLNAVCGVITTGEIKTPLSAGWRIMHQGWWRHVVRIYVRFLPHLA